MEHYTEVGIADVVAAFISCLDDRPLFRKSTGPAFYLNGDILVFR